MKYLKKDEKEFLKFFEKDNQDTVQTEIRADFKDPLVTAAYNHLSKNRDKYYGGRDNVKLLVETNNAVSELIEMYKELLQKTPNDTLKSLIEKE